MTTMNKTKCDGERVLLGLSGKRVACPNDADSACPGGCGGSYCVYHRWAKFGPFGRDAKTGLITGYGWIGTCAGDSDGHAGHIEADYQQADAIL